MNVNFVPIVVPEREVSITMTERQARLLSAYMGSISSQEFARGTNKGIESCDLALRKITDPNDKEDNVSWRLYSLLHKL